jgi:hypothetical protein
VWHNLAQRGRVVVPIFPENIALFVARGLLSRRT